MPKFGLFAKYLKASIIITISVSSLVRPCRWLNSNITGQFFIIFNFLICFEYLSRKFKFHLNLFIKGILIEELCLFIIVYRSISVRMRDVWGKFLEKVITRVLCSKDLFLLIWPFTRKGRNYVTTTEFRVGNIVRCMCFTCWIPKTTSTHLRYVIILLFHCKIGYKIVS